MCDGVAAITATLLVIDLKVPFGDADVLNLTALHEQAHLLLAWAISFLMVGVVWYEQHLVFANSARLDTPFIVVAMVQLAFLSLIPFGSALIGGYPTSLVAAFAFTAIMFLNGMMVAIQSFMLADRRHLQRGPEARGLAERGRLQLATYAGVAMFSILVAALHVPLTGILAWGLSPFLLKLHKAGAPEERSADADLKLARKE